VITEDPMMGRGGCRVVAESSTVDARLETRVGAVIAHVLGDERTGAGTGEPGS
jgi:flagellar assembly protein FliH